MAQLSRTLMSHKITCTRPLRGTWKSENIKVIICQLRLSRAPSAGARIAPQPSFWVWQAGFAQVLEQVVEIGRVPKRVALMNLRERQARFPRQGLLQRRPGLVRSPECGVTRGGHERD